MEIKLKHARISDNPSKDDISLEIERLSVLKTDYQNKDAATKVLINSLYGVAGYRNYIGYNKDVAASITGQSRDIIRYTIRIINKFFNEIYPEHTALHEHLGIKPKAFRPYRVVNYADTDSVFFVLDTIYRLSGYKGDIVDFVLKINDFALKAYIIEKLGEYVEGFSAFQKRMDGKASFNLALENICFSVMWVKKKKYVKHLAWKKGASFKPYEKYEIKGLESNQSSTPKFVRQSLDKIIKLIVKDAEDGKNVEETLHRELIGVRAAFDEADVRDICKTERISKYDADNVRNDSTGLSFEKGVKAHIKGAAYYNKLIYNNPQYQSQYDLIRAGQKVSHYAALEADLEVFSFPVGDFPVFAPKVDYERQFEKVMLSPINNIVKALGIEMKDPNNANIMPSLW